MAALAKPNEFQMVLSDVMMPGGMDGMALVREMRQRRISLPVVLVSGFSAAAKRDAETEGIPLLPKPYSLGDLASLLNAALSRPRAPSPECPSVGA